MIIKDDKQSIENLKQFIMEWAGPALTEYGLSEGEVPRSLPKPLRDLYLFAGNWPHQRDNNDCYFRPGKEPRIFQEQDGLYGVNNLESNNGRIKFIYENQENWTCEVEEGNDESPVYCDAAALWDSNVKGHELVCESLPHFLVTFCLQELVMSSKHLGTIKVDSEHELVRTKLEPVWLEGFYVFKEPTHSLYICEQSLLILKLYSDFWYACKDENALSLVLYKDKCKKMY